MEYGLRYDRIKHETYARAIKKERKAIAQHYRILISLQDKLLRLGTPDEVLAKKLALDSRVRGMDGLA